MIISFYLCHGLQPKYEVKFVYQNYADILSEKRYFVYVSLNTYIPSARFQKSRYFKINARFMPRNQFELKKKYNSTTEIDI